MVGKGYKKQAGRCVNTSPALTETRTDEVQRMAKVKPICAVDGCNKVSDKKNFCNSHYLRFRRHGSPTAGGTSMGAVEKWVADHVNHKGDACLIWPFAMLATGYGAMRFRGRNSDAHRTMCILAHGEPPTPKHEAAHSCGNGSGGCVNPHHLRWATRAENMEDRALHGSGNRGGTHYNAKLTEDDVRQIRAISSGLSQSEIAHQFGIDASHVSNIVSRKAWAWLT